MRKRLPLCLAVLACLFAAPALADTIVFDDFNDGVLDPKWSVNFTDNSNGNWAYNESGGALNVTSIGYRYSTPWNDRGHDWAHVNLTQYFDPINDFDLDLKFPGEPVFQEWSKCG